MKGKCSHILEQNILNMRKIDDMGILCVINNNNNNYKIIKIVLYLGNFSSFLVLTLLFLNLCVLPQGVFFN